MNQKERMLAGLPYRAGQDGLPKEHLENKRKIYEYNLCRPDKIGRARALLKDILGVCGNNVTLLAPFRCDYGKNIEIADDVFINYNCVILDVARVVIGRGTLFIRCPAAAVTNTVRL